MKPQQRCSPGVHFTLIVSMLVIALAGCTGSETNTTTTGTESASSAQAPAGAPWFEEGAIAAGVDFVHSTGADGKHFWFPESFCGGVAVFDFDNDGLLDIYFVQAAQLEPGQPTLPNRLFRNLGGRRFEDVTDRAGVGDGAFGIGCSCGDYDNDGDVDLFVSNFGPDRLYRNNGDGTFTDVAAATGVASPRLSSSAAFADYDNDGDLDLYSVHYVEWTKALELACYNPRGQRDYCPPVNYNAPAQDVLYRNNGDGTFTDVSEEAGLDAVFGSGFGIAVGDFNADRRLDFFVANDGMPNQLWIQGENGTFTDDALWRGVAVNEMGDAEAGMGAGTVDIDHDGDLDLLLSHLKSETNTLYRNDGEGSFDDVTDQYGFGSASYDYTGWGLGFADFNNDTHLESFVANGGVIHPGGDAADPYEQYNLLTTSQGQGRFVAVTPAGGTDPPILKTSRGVAFGDLDNDGGVDLVIVNRDAQASLLWNVAAGSKQWIRFRVLDRGRDAHYARVKITGAFGTRWGVVDRSYSYASANDPRVHFGLGDATSVESVELHWPDGTHQSFGAMDSGQTHTLTRTR